MLDPDAVRRLGLGSGGHVHPSFPHATSTNQRLATASHLVAGREAWRIRVCVRRLARGRGPVVVADAAPRAPQSPALALQGGVRLRGVARVPGRARRAGVGRRARGLPGPQRLLDRRLGRVRRRDAGDQRPGALRARVDGAARVCPRARGAPDRRRADLRRARQRRRHALARAVPRRRRGRGPARRVHGRRASCGATRSTTGPRCAGGTTAGGSSACGGPSTSSTSPASTTSAASRPTGRCRATRATPPAGRWVRGPGRAVFDAARAELGAPAADRRGPRRDHARRHAPARVAGPARDGRAAVRLQPATSSRASHRPERYRAGQVLYTGTHDNDTLRGWYETLAPESVALVRAAGVGRASRGGGSWSWRSPRRRGCACSRSRTSSGLGSEARMNAPGVAGGQWRWRLHDGQLTPALARRLRRLTADAGPPAVTACGTACAYSITEGKRPAAAPGRAARRVTAWDQATGRPGQ